MRSWPIDAQGSAGPTADAVLAGIIEAVGAPNFAAQALTQLNRLLQAGSWSVYRIGSGRAPVMYLSGSYRRRDTTVYCWRAYRAGLYRRDATFDGAGMQARRHGATLCHVTASEIPQREHRDRIYRRFGVLDRLSIVAPQPDDTLLAINLYRHQQQGHFSDREFATLEQVARGVLAAVSRHIALTGHPAAGTARPSIATLRAGLERAYPALSGREADVCARLLGGMTYDGIAADMGISVATAKTYRNRAFARLGIHFRSELFALCLGAARPPAGLPED